MTTEDVERARRDGRVRSRDSRHRAHRRRLLHVQPLRGRARHVDAHEPEMYDQMGAPRWRRSTATSGQPRWRSRNPGTPRTRVASMSSASRVSVRHARELCGSLLRTCLRRPRRRTRAAPSKASSRTRPAASSPVRRSSPRELETGLRERDHDRRRRLLPTAPAPGRPVQRDRRRRRSSPRSCRSRFRVNVSQTVRVIVPARAVVDERDGDRERRRASSSTRRRNVLGRVVTGRELVDLPLNGRNFTQLGLLQTGVAPLTAGVATAGGSLRQGQAYAVNGMRPEQNVYLVDGAPEHEPHGRRLRAEAAGGRHRRVPHPDAERAAGVRRHRRRHDQRRDEVGQQPSPRQRLRVRAQRRLRRAQLLLARGRTAQAESVRRHARRTRSRPIGSSSSATTKASATSRASRRRPPCRRRRSGGATSRG